MTATPPLMALQWLFLKVAPRLAARFPHVYHRNLSRLLQARIRVTGDAIAPGPCLLAVNHTSWLDIVVLSAVAPVSFIAKSEVNGWPFFGSLARLQRSLFIERDRRTATGAFRDLMQYRLGLGDRLVLFPEGTSSDGNRVLPFKSALMGAVETQVGDARGERRPVPVQPVTVAYTHLHGLPIGRRERPFFAWYGDMDLVPHLWEALRRGPIDVEVCFHAPVTVNDLDNRKRLALHCEEAVREGLVTILSHNGDTR
jgi:1-acyl-sn-glycerol-3-phosphate acyltransferase